MSLAKRIVIVILVLLMAVPGQLLAADGQQSGVGAVDYGVLGLYIAGTILLGYFISKRQKSREEYFTGGGNMNSILIGVSLFATLLSTISYLGMPGEAAGKGPVHFVGLIGHPLIFLIFAVVMLPTYMKYRVTSAYELLEDKLGVGFRLLGGIMLLVLRLIWMAVLLKAAGDAMITMLGIDQSWSLLVVAVIGLVAIIYTSLGGLQAVVITDAMQTILLYGGAVTVLIIITIDFGGFGWIPSEWPAEWDSQPYFPPDLETRVTWFGSILTGVIWYVATLGSDQTTVQRFMATKDAAGARSAVLWQLCVSVVVGITLCFVGIALMSHYKSIEPAAPVLESGELADYEEFEVIFKSNHDDAKPKAEDIVHFLSWSQEEADAVFAYANRLQLKADQYFPHFIANGLPTGLTGLVIAAMFAAAMSSLDSGVNSITAVVSTDFIERVRTKKLTEQQQLVTARLIAVIVGVVVVFGSVLTEFIQGNIMEITASAVNLLTTPIFGLFVYALYFKRPNAIIVATATLIGILTALYLAFGDEMGWHKISFQWIGPFSLTANLGVGFILHALLDLTVQNEATPSASTTTSSEQADLQIDESTNEQDSAGSDS